MLANLPKRMGQGRREFCGPNFLGGRLNNEWETMFNRFFAPLQMPYEGWPHREPKWGFEMEEFDDKFVIQAEAPGFEAQDFEVFVSGNILMLKAEHKALDKEKKDGSYCCERSWEENVTLPVGINPDAIEASYKNGILELHVPKLEEIKPRRVVVKT